MPRESRPTAGPHGGPLVAMRDGYVELSVFETNVPPRFRLYFTGAQGEARPAPDTEVALETMRPSGERQAFSFESRGSFLESRESIPEPHEFSVRLRVGAEALAEVPFTEAAHGHDHEGVHPHSSGGDRHGDDEGHTHEGAHGHGHGGDENGGHGHHHGGGLAGWLTGVFGHSHSVVDRIDSNMESNERGIWALKVSLVGLGLTAAFQVVIALVSGSVGLLADTIHNFADAGTSLPLWVAFALAKRGASRRFTYGYGKTEDVAGVLIVAIIFLSACVAAWESVRKIIHPQPVDHLWWVAAAAIIGFLGNEAVAVLRIRVGNEIGSAALVADGQHARVDGFTSLAVLVGVAGVRMGVPILDPLVGLGITIAILFIVKDAAKAIWIRLIDGIEPEILAQIEHAPTHVAGVKGVEQVRARWVGHKVLGDVEISVDPTLSVSEGYRISQEVRRSLREHVRLLGDAVVSVRPAGTTRMP